MKNPKNAEECAQMLADARASIMGLESELRMMKARVPHTADGFPVFLGDEVWFYEEDSGRAMSSQVTAIYAKSPVHGHVYPGKFVIGADWYEDGDSKFYHVRGAVPIPAT